MLSALKLKRLINEQIQPVVEEINKNMLPINGKLFHVKHNYNFPITGLLVNLMNNLVFNLNRNEYLQVLEIDEEISNEWKLFKNNGNSTYELISEILSLLGIYLEDSELNLIAQEHNDERYTLLYSSKDTEKQISKQSLMDKFNI